MKSHVGSLAKWHRGDRVVLGELYGSVTHVEHETKPRRRTLLTVQWRDALVSVVDPATLPREMRVIHAAHDMTLAAQPHAPAPAKPEPPAPAKPAARKASKPARKPGKR